jgi:hypothetical protein
MGKRHQKEADIHFQLLGAIVTIREEEQVQSWNAGKHIKQIVDAGDGRVILRVTLNNRVQCSKHQIVSVTKRNLDGLSARRDDVWNSKCASSSRAQYSRYARRNISKPAKFAVTAMMPAAGPPPAMPPAATRTLHSGKVAAASARTKCCAARSVRVDCSPPSLQMQPPSLSWNPTL